jgi:hypothetical protein
MKTMLLLCLLGAAARAFAVIPVTDAANLANNTLLHAENIAKWVESLNHLRTQIDQLNRQIAIQDDLRKWSGNPVEAGASVVLDGLGAGDLLRTYGQTKDAVLGTVDSLASLQHTARGSFRALADLDLNGGELHRDPLHYRRYAVLDATQANAEQVATATQARESELQTEIAATLEQLKDAPTEAETEKLAAKLTALNGQLTQVDATRRREVDAVTLQKIANDSRREEERLAAADLAAKDDHLANQRVTTYMKTLRVRQGERR